MVDLGLKSEYLHLNSNKTTKNNITFRYQSLVAVAIVDC